MPQLRDIGVKIRAAIAIVAVWALTFGAAMSGGAAASATDTVVRNSGPGGLFACFKRHVTQHEPSQPDAGGKSSPGGAAGQHHCPCCLAAGAAAAVLPARIPALAEPRPEPRRAPRVVSASPALARAPPPSINGARAPPA